MNKNERQLHGIHHVTAIGGDPQENVDFYVGVMGMRLVKRSVNQDDPGTYHLFYADAIGSPGTDLTFFAWPGGMPGRDGTGQLATVALAVPENSLEYWMKRLAEHDIDFEGPAQRFDEEVITFSDRHAQRLDLVAAPDVASREWRPWVEGPVSEEFAVRGIHSVTMREGGENPTVAFLTQELGFRLNAESGGRKRFSVGPGGSGAWLDLLVAPGMPRARIAVGTIHHVAWRTPGDQEQEQWQRQLANAGVGVTEIIDRFWFHSIYFREPGGVLFEIATDGPGFTVDESAEELGTQLVLPPWLEPHRKRIEDALPPIKLPEFVGKRAGAGRRG